MDCDSLQLIYIKNLFGSSWLRNFCVIEVYLSRVNCITPHCLLPIHLASVAAVEVKLLVGWSLNELNFGRRDYSFFISCISLAGTVWLLSQTRGQICGLSLCHNPGFLLEQIGLMHYTGIAWRG